MHALLEGLKTKLTGIKFVNKLLGREYPYQLLQFKMRRLAVTKYPMLSRAEIEALPEIDVVMLTLDRLPETKRTLESLFAVTQMKFRLIILDMNSATDTREYLTQFAKQHSNVELKFFGENLGVSGGRAAGLKLCKHDYVAFLDNDMILMPQYLERLTAGIVAQSEIVALQPKVVLPNGTIQINFPTLEIKGQIATFFDADMEKRFDDPSTLSADLCEWTPMGATIWRRQVFDEVQIDTEMLGSFEDNEYTYRLHQQGYKFKTCPAAMCIHVRSEFTPQALQNTNYTQARFNFDKTRAATKRFFAKHGLIFSFGQIDKFAQTIGFETAADYIKFIQD